MTESNPEIAVELTGDDVAQCFRLRLGEASVLLHARDMADLGHKVNLALLDWISEQMGELLRAELAADPRLVEAAELLGIDLSRPHP